MKPLYKLNTQGKIETWKIEVFDYDIEDITDMFPAVIKTTYGELKGKQQSKTFQIHCGKNIGKKNETTILEQAFAEAEAKWLKQLKKGYVENLKDAQAGKTDSIITGGVIPMLAHSYDDHKDKIQFPVLAQPKLDGQRCLAHYKNGKVTLWTRTRKPILSCPHVIEELEKILKGQTEMYLDGELYNHALKDDFEKLMSAVRKQKPSEESLKIHYWVYDCILPEGGCTGARNMLIDSFNFMNKCKHIKLTPTRQLISHDLLESYQKSWIEMGYEGLMVRALFVEYEHKRSKHLLKMKTFQDAEFKITNVVPGKDNSVVFVCETEDGTKFEATKSGDKEKNQIYLKKSSLWKGKQLTVKFQGLTGARKVPRFPVALRIRDEE